MIAHATPAGPDMPAKDAAAREREGHPAVLTLAVRELSPGLLPPGLRPGRRISSADSSGTQLSP
jgi:hypothetical protein